MSREYNYYAVQKDTIPTKPGKYFYKLSFEPIMDSFNIQFNESINVSRIRFNESNVYNYHSYETYYSASELEFKVVKIIGAGLSEYEDMGITHLPVTSQESLIYAKELIGTRYVMGKNIIDITLDNYTTYYQSLLVGMVFIDFSLSEKIMNVVDAVDTASGLSLYDQLDATYFYGNF